LPARDPIYVFADRGEHEVKNIARPVRVYAMSADAVASVPLGAPAASAVAKKWRIPIIALCLVALLATGIGGWWVWRDRTSPFLSSRERPASTAGILGSAVPRLSIIVLPFENLSPDPDQQYFADAITDDLTTDLSRIAGSFVIARNTAYSYRGQVIDVKQIGRDLGVHYVLEGSVRRLAEISVDGGEADIGNLVERRQRFHHQFANLVARNVAPARTFELAHDRVDGALGAVSLEIPLAQGDVDRAGELVAIEWLALPILLDHRQVSQLDTFEGGEPSGAVRTRPAAANGAAIIGRP